MISARVALTVVSLAGAAVGVASPAAAEPLSGAYRFDSTSDGTSRWTITPCLPNTGCGLLVGVSDVSNELIERFVGRAVWRDDRWHMTVDQPAAIRCALNDWAFPARFELSWSPETLSGDIVTFQSTPNCGLPAMTVRNSGTFTLTKIIG